MSRATAAARAAVAAIRMICQTGTQAAAVVRAGIGGGET
jgi:hypothetical protein